MTPFQLVLTGVFAAFILIGVAFFALFRGGGTSGPVANVTVWGFVDRAVFTQVLESTGINDDPSLNVTEYIQVSRESFDQEFIEALARGDAPDVVMMPHTSLARHADKIFPIPYDSYPERTFVSTFVEGGEIFLGSEGVLAVPFSLDPLVMYWNRTLFNNAGIAQPPEYWDQFFTLTQDLVETDASFNIDQSAIAFGEYRNVTNAKEIVSTLIMQSGSPIVQSNNGTVRSTLADSFNQPVRPADAAINFYTEFSNPVKSFYSWNRSLPDSQQFFTSGDLAVYFGFASEAVRINERNPNLNFDVAVLPQSRGGEETMTFANMTGLAIPQVAQNKAGSVRFINAITSDVAIDSLSEVTGLPPVRRDLITNTPSDPVRAVFYDSALWARAWLDPDPVQTDTIFQTMIENITSGRESVSGSVQQASTRLQGLVSDITL